MSMQSYTFSLALRIWHPDIDPDVISHNLGLKAKYSAIAGAERVTPSGRKLSGIHSESYWCSDPFERGEYQSTDDIAEDAIADVIDVLKPKKSFLRLLRDQGGRINLEIASFSHRNYVIELSPELLAASADLGLAIVHDVFPCAQGI